MFSLFGSSLNLPRLTLASSMLLFCGASVVAQTPPAPAQQRPEMDRPTARAAWLAEWYNEGAGDDVRAKGKQGGPWSLAFRRQMLDASAAERAKWGRMIPGVLSSGALKNSATTAAAAPGSNWVNLGPTKANIAKNGVSLNKTDAGRVSALLFDPNNTSIIYAAFAGGGVWKTTDDGVSWTTLTDHLGSLSVGALTMQPGNSSTLYLGLGDAFDGTGIGMMKSTDGGTTWTGPVYVGDSTVINAIKVSPANPSVVLAATNTGLFRSTDAGGHWSRVALATGQTGNPYVWAIESAGGSKFVMSLEALPAASTGTTDGQVWVSSDSGGTWTRSSGVTKTSGVGRISLGVAASNTKTMYAMAGVPNAADSSDLADIFKSTNGGTTWKALNAPKKKFTNTNSETPSMATLLRGQGWYNQVVMVDPNNPKVAYFGGALLLARTDDGGSSFSQKTNWLAQFSLPYAHADFHAGAMLGSTMLVGTDGGIFKSTDGATSFTDALNVGLTTHLIYSVGSSTASPDAVIGGFQDNGTRVREGSTSTFNQYLGGDGFGSAIHATNGQTMLGSLYYSRIYKSTNGGVTFSPSSTGIKESNNPSTAPFNTGLVSWPGQADTVFTWTNAKVYKSTNYAGSWAALGTNGLPTTSFAIRGLGVARTDVNVLGLVASGGRVFVSVNGGTDWTACSAPPNNGFSLSKISFDPVQPSTFYVTSVAADATKNHVWKYSSTGTALSACTGTAVAIDGGGFPFGVPVNTISVDPNSANALYAGTHLGVYRSLDAGGTWARFGSGMPLVSVNDFYISQDSSLMRAATFGRGFWELRP